MRNKGLFIQLVLLVIILVASYFFIQDKRMSDNWMGPYLSAAHNLEWAGSFQINIDEVKNFKSLNDSDQDTYNFKVKNNLIHYNHNPIGYAYLIKSATIIFPFLGDQMAILILQCLVFFLINLIFLTHKDFSLKQKWLFFILFSINPIILRYVPFNFYYFWQIIPSVIFGYLLLSKTPNKIIISILIFILPFIILTRPTIIFTLLLIFYFLYKKIDYKFLLLSGIYVLVFTTWLYQPIKKNIWHTVYIGIGAYNNSYGIKLSDTDAYKLYEDKTGKKLEASVGGNYYNEEIINNYTEITKTETLKIFRDRPFLFIKNAFINTLQGYSLGYINKGGDWLNYLIAFTGLIFIAVLLYFKKYSWFLMIGFSIGTFTIYYPPIQAYMYGVYLLLVLALLSIKLNPKISKI